MLAQAAHLAQILLAADGVDDGASGKEEKSLEEGMRDEVEDGSRVGRDTAAEEHEAELGNSGVSEHALDVVLDQRNRGGKQRRGRAHNRHYAERKGRVIEEDTRAGNHVYAGRDHGGGVDERGDRCGTFHGVGQPDIERKLRALSGRAEKQTKRDGGEHTTLPGRACGQLRRDLAEGQGAEVRQQKKDSDEKAEVADAVHDESFFAGICGRVLLKIEADEQIRREANALPAYKHQQYIAGQHQHRHEEEEEIEESEIARVSLFMTHVSDGVDMNQETHAGDDEKHDQGKLIQNKAEINVQRTNVDPAHRAGFDVGQGTC